MIFLIPPRRVTVRFPWSSPIPKSRTYGRRVTNTDEHCSSPIPKSVHLRFPNQVRTVAAERKSNVAPDRGSRASAGGSRGQATPTNHGARAEGSMRGRAGRREVAARSWATRRGLSCRRKASRRRLHRQSCCRCPSIHPLEQAARDVQGHDRTEVRRPSLGRAASCGCRRRRKLGGSRRHRVSARRRVCGRGCATCTPAARAWEGRHPWLRHGRVDHPLDGEPPFPSIVLGCQAPTHSSPRRWWSGRGGRVSSAAVPRSPHMPLRSPPLYHQSVVVRRHLSGLID
jgi:hypothetical protein